MSTSPETGASGAPLSLEPRRADEKHCHACGQRVHATAVACPHCGAPQPPMQAGVPMAPPPGALPAGHVYCRGCGHAVHQTATACPRCGAPQGLAASPADGSAAAGGGSPWLAGISLALGLICILALFDPSEWDDDTLVGYFALAIGGLATGIGAVASGPSSRGMAITGLVLSSIALVAGIGLLEG